MAGIPGAPTPLGPARRALVIAGDTAVRGVREGLETLELRVDALQPGSAELEQIRRQPPDLLLLDAARPDALALCAGIRAEAWGEHLPILLLSSPADPEAIRRGYEAGASDFSVGPLDGALLQQRVRYLLRSSQALARLRDWESRLGEAQELAGLGHWELDLDSGTVEGSALFRQLLGLPDHGRIDVQHVLAAIHPEDREALAETVREAAATGTDIDVACRVLTPDGGERVVLSQGRPAGAGPKQPILLGVAQDITERVETRRRLRQLALFDDLTGLGNRRLFAKRLEAAIAQARRFDRLCGVVTLDVDQFKRVNETLGHRAGDELLRQLSERLVAALRASDVVSRSAGTLEPSLCRMGGDEFTLLLPDLAHPRDANTAARRILGRLKEPFSCVGQEVVLSASLGIAVWPTDGEDAETLVGNAAAAMHHAKGKGPNHTQVYTHSISAEARDRLSMEAEIRRALEAGRIRLHYQPKIDLRTGHIAGAEALVRMHDEAGEIISPAQFIPISEETGVILQLGKEILRQACRQVQTWGGDGIDLRVSVNLSPVQFADENLAATVRDIVRDHGLSPDRIDLEITEGALLHNEAEAIQQLRVLKALGLSLSLDDFGTGYSSMSYLKRLPLDYLKIDQSFVRGLERDRSDALITDAIISMAKALDLRVVAEGVETPGQRQFLAERCCDEVQGYLFSRPLPPEDFEAFYRANSR